MVKINGVYLYNEKIISVLNDVNLHQQAYSKYFICIELKSIESDDTYGGIAYQLSGRPFIMSADEIMKCKEVELSCQKCAFFSQSIECSSDISVCVCRYEQFEASNNDVLCFRPYCKKFHNGGWQLTEVDNKKAAKQICSYLATSEIDLCGINNENAKYIREKSFLKHYLDSKQFFEFVGDATDTVIFISEYLYFLESKLQIDPHGLNYVRNMQPHVYIINDIFDYSCYCYLNSLNTVPYNAFLLKNGKAIFQHCENVVLYDNGDIYFLELSI